MVHLLEDFLTHRLKILFTCERELAFGGELGVN